MHGAQVVLLSSLETMKIYIIQDVTKKSLQFQLHLFTETCDKYCVLFHWSSNSREVYCASGNIMKWCWTGWNAQQNSLFKSMFSGL